MKQWLMDAWESNWVVINKKTFYVILLAAGLYGFYKFAYNRGMVDMYQYLASLQNQEEVKSST